MAVTTITTTITSSGNHIVTSTVSQTECGNGSEFIAAPDINDAPDRLKFAYWLPNVSGGLVISKISQKTQCEIRFPKSSLITNVILVGTTNPTWDTRRKLKVLGSSMP